MGPGDTALDPRSPRPSLTPEKKEDSSVSTSDALEDMAGGDDSLKIQKFNGRTSDDCNLWRVRAETALKGKGYWSKLNSDNCDSDVKDKASAMLVNALGDLALRVCMNEVSEPMKMLKLLDNRYASSRAATRISVLTSVYAKRWNGKEHMGKFVDEFESLFSQLERMGEDVKIPETHKGPLLLASIGHGTVLESTVAALRLKDTSDLKWPSITSDLIQEHMAIRSSQMRGRKSGKNSESVTQEGSCSNQQNSKRHSASTAKNSTSKKDQECTYCGRKGHTREKCWINPDSDDCRLPEETKKKMANRAKTDNNSSKTVHFASTVILSEPQSESAQGAKNLCPEHDKSILDSGASTSFFKYKSEVLEGSYIKKGCGPVQLAAGDASAKSLGQGTLCVKDILLPNSIHISNLNSTLISAGKVCDTKRLVVFTSKEAVVLELDNFSVDREKIVAIAKRNATSGLYEFESSTMMHSTRSASPQVKTVAKREDITKWHRRLVHANVRTLKSMHKFATGMPKMKGNLKSCHPCHLGKAKRKTFDSHFKGTTGPGEVVHSDVAGPMPTSHYGNKYFVTFTDQFSRFTHAVSIPRKADVPDVYEMYKETSEVRKFFPNGILRIHSDGGGEYQKVGSIEATATTTETPQHNPFAERVNRTILEPIRVLLEEAGLSRSYWDYALDHVVYVKNRLLHKGIGCSPFEKLTGNKPTLRHVRVFGCSAFVYNHDPATKVHARSMPGIFLGCNDHGVYAVELITSRKLVNSVHTTFDEDTFPALEGLGTTSSSEDEEEIAQQDETTSSASDIFPPGDTSSEEEINEQTSEEQIIPRYPTRKREKPARLGFNTANRINFPITTSDEPTVEEALSSTPQEIEEWYQAIKQELDGLDEMRTWKQVGTVASFKESNKGVKLLPTQIILRIKRDEHGSPSRFKARLVAGGNLQIVGQDVDQVYAPVVDYSIVLLLLAIGKQYNWCEAHVDVKSAFLNGEVDAEVYVTHPYNVPKWLRENKVYQLIKALYGLRQAPLRWFLKLRDVLIHKLGYPQLRSDGSVFVKGSDVIRAAGDNIVIILAYVDDLIILSNDTEKLNCAIQEFLMMFKRSCENLNWYLSIRVQDD